MDDDVRTDGGQGRVRDPQELADAMDRVYAERPEVLVRPFAIRRIKKVLRRLYARLDADSVTRADVAEAVAYCLQVLEE